MNPLGMTFYQWLAEVSIVADVSGYTPANPKASEWRDIARRLNDATPFKSLATPDPSRYPDWVSWAIAFQDAARQVL